MLDFGILIVAPQGMPVALIQFIISAVDPEFVISMAMPLAKLFLAFIFREIIGAVGRGTVNVLDTNVSKSLPQGRERGKSKSIPYAQYRESQLQRGVASPQ